LYVYRGLDILARYFSQAAKEFQEFVKQKQSIIERKSKSFRVFQEFFKTSGIFLGNQQLQWEMRRGKKEFP
jgi:hypothetical protein